MPPKEFARRVKRLVERGLIESAAEIPEGAIPVDPDAVLWGYSGKPPAWYRDRKFSCKDCGKLENWFKEDQMWYREVVKAPFEKRAIRCRECREKEKKRKEAARKASGHAE